MAPSKPWADVIPPEDIASFRCGADPSERPLSAGTRPALVVVDFTREFVDDDYPTGWSATGRPAVLATARLLDRVRAAGLPVYFTKRFEDPAHVASAAEMGRWKVMASTKPVDEVTGALGDEIVDELRPIAGETVVHKAGRPSGFSGTRLASLLIHDRVDTLVVAGMTTSGCVRATALDAFMLNLHVVIPFECVADRSQISHRVSLFDLHMKYADVISLDETIEWLDALV